MARSCPRRPPRDPELDERQRTQILQNLRDDCLEQFGQRAGNRRLKGLGKVLDAFLFRLSLKHANDDRACAYADRIANIFPRRRGGKALGRLLRLLDVANPASFPSSDPDDIRDVDDEDRTLARQVAEVRKAVEDSRLRTTTVGAQFIAAARELLRSLPELRGRGGQARPFLRGLKSEIDLCLEEAFPRVSVAERVKWREDLVFPHVAIHPPKKK